MMDGLARKTRLADVEVVGDLVLGGLTVIASGSPPSFLFLPKPDFLRITTGGRGGGVCSSRKVSEVHGRRQDGLPGDGTEKELLPADDGVGGKSE